MYYLSHKVVQVVIFMAELVLYVDKLLVMSLI